MQTFDVNKFDIAKFDSILARGLSKGLGEVDGQMCIEAVICKVLNLPHSDDPGCVIQNLRRFKISLNDNTNWSSPEARARGLRDLGLAQLGSLGVVDDKEFSRRLAEKTIRVLIPKLFRLVFTDVNCLAAADRCEREGTAKAAHAAYAAADAAHAAYAAADAAAAARAAASSASAYDAASAAASSAADAAYDAAAATRAADAAADASAASDEFLCLSAALAIEVLQELKSPGCALLDKSREI